MAGRIFTIIALLVSLSGLPFAADEFSLLNEERIGDLRIGLSETEVKMAVKCPLKQGAEEFWAADGAYHQEWSGASCGITLGMVSAKKGGPKSVESITVVRPSKLGTKRGIRIGSTALEVMKAYKAHWNEEESKHFGRFVAGSIYGGLMFDIRDGRVSGIFLGAAAE
jgi:hypothetical protein